jgi:hypothetical protein
VLLALLVLLAATAVLAWFAAVSRGLELLKGYLILVNALRLLLRLPGATQPGTPEPHFGLCCILHSS